MGTIETELALIAARATSLSERLTGRVPLDTGAHNARLADERLTRWGQMAAEGHPDRFGKRLLWDGYTHTEAWRVLGSPPLPVVQHGLGLLEQLLEEGTEGSAPGTLFAIGRLRAGSWPVEESAIQDMAACLADDVSRILAPTLRHEREAEKTPAERLLGLALGEGAPDLRMAMAGIDLSFWNRYPVLARRTVLCIERWLAAAEEMLGRLVRDLPQLRGTFGLRGHCAHMQGGLSDPHHQGRTVWVLTFGRGCRVVYKPRSLAIDEAFYRVLAASNTDLKSLKVLPSGQDYGWVEYADTLDCKPSEEVMYFSRAGQLLALLHLLRGRDFHHENVLGGGTEPIPVDLEALVQHDFVHWDSRFDRATLGAAEHSFLSSVVRIGLLPQWQSDGGDTVIDRSALFPSNSHRATTVPDLENALEGGFAESYRWFLSHRTTLLEEGGILEAFKGLSVRALVRNTRVYATLGQKAVQPDVAGDGIESSLSLEILSRPFLGEPEPPPLWTTVGQEIAQLYDGDIPYFSAATDSILLDQTERPVFAAPSYDALRKRLDGFSEVDLQRQCAYIRGAVAARYVTVDVAVGRHVPAESKAPASSEFFLTEAKSIAARILARVHRGDDGSVEWIGFGRLPQGRLQLQPLGDGLYDGRAGIAVFFAGLFRLTGLPEYRETALACLGGMVARMRSDPLGMAAGCAGICYALVKAATLLEAPTLLGDAEQAARVMAAAPEGDLDVLGGSAGNLLAFMALDAQRPVSKLETAVSLGDHISSRLGEIRLCGFSHGAAGIARALAELGAKSGEPRFKEAARRLVAFENSLYVPEIGWPDLRNAEPSEMNAWCHGATGIGLARLAMSDFLGKGECEVDIGRALDAVPDELSGFDHPCCGNCSYIELLLEAVNRGHPAYLERAQARAAAVATEAKQNDGYHLLGEPEPALFHPGFFQGLSGIGYTLLRLVDPGLPSILCFR